MAIRVAVSPADRTTFKKPGLVDETNVGGTLRAIGVSGGVRKHFFSIEIDGSPILTETAPNQLNKYFNDSMVYGGQQTHNSMGVNLPFDDELQIQIKDNPVKCSRPRFWAVYEKNMELGDDVGMEDEEENNSVEVEDGFVVDQQEFETDRGTNTERILKGRKISAEVVFAERAAGVGKDVYSVDEPIAVELRFVNWKGDYLDEQSGDTEQVPEAFVEVSDIDETVGLFLRPSGRNYPVESFEMEWDEESTVEFSVDTPGDYELLTDFPNFGNIPVTFSVRPEW